MGKRRHVAALGATFALLVAACATTDSQLANAPELALAPKPSTTAVDTSTGELVFPAVLADASFIQPDTSANPCRASHPAQATVLATDSGEKLWSFPIPAPGGLSVANDSAAYISFRADHGQSPGIGALDLNARAPLWQRFFETEPQNLLVTDESLIVVTRDSVRALDLTSGQDLWINDNQFDFDNVILAEDVAYALDSTGVKAIDYRTGRAIWTLNDVQRGDAISLADNTIAVAARTRIVAIDIEARGRLWDIDTADRVGAGDIWSTPDTIFFEVSPSVAPGGGVTALDRDTGEELWSQTNIGNPVFVGTDQLITSTASGDQPPGEPFEFVAYSAITGEELWRLNSTAQVFEGVVGTTSGQIVISDPHPAAPGHFRVRLLNSATGAIQWESNSTKRFDGAEFDLGAFVALYGTSDRPAGDIGNVSLVLGTGTSWSADLTGGVAQPPQLTTEGLLVVSPSQFSCIGRMVGEPAPSVGSGVLGATTERAVNGS